MRKSIPILFIAFLLYSAVDAQTALESTVDSASLDPSIRYGRLSNGLTYYIKSLDKPLPKQFLNLYVRAGYNQEDKDQLNIAHAVEHMAFKASKNYPSGISNSKLRNEELNMFDYGGFTGPRITDYYFNVPKDNLKVLNSGLLWFQDIISGLKLKDRDIDQVRGELREEFVVRGDKDLNLGYAKANLKSAFFPGKKTMDNFFDHNKTFAPETLRRFYKDWYHPELMALSVVGNIKNIDSIERLIMKNFSDIPPAKKMKKNKDYDDLYYKQSGKFAVVKRPLLTKKNAANESFDLQLIFRNSTIMSELHTLDGVRQLEKLRLLAKAASHRINNSTNEYNAFDAGVVNLLDGFDSPPGLAINITSTNKIKNELKKVMQILHQLHSYGLTETEWDDLKNKHLQNFDNIDKKNEKYWVEGIARHFKYGETFPSDKFERLKKWLTALSLAEFNSYLHNFLSKMPEDIGVIAPTGHKAFAYTENEFRSWIKEVYQKPVETYKVPVTPDRLMNNEEIAKLREKKYELKKTAIPGAQTVVLNNGLKVVMKTYTPTTGAYDDKIMLHGFKPMGASNFARRDQYSAMLAGEIIRNSGVGDMDKFKLRRFLNKTSISIRPYIGFYETGISGNTNLQDLEKALQLVYLYFTSPRRDSIAFEDWKRTEHENYRYPGSSSTISSDFYSAIREITGDSSVLRGPLGIPIRIIGATKRFEGVQETNMKVAYEKYRTLFRNADNFTFIISGNFNVDSVLPLIQKYLGNLPNDSNANVNYTIKEDAKILPPAPFFKRIKSPEYYSMNSVKYSLRFIKKFETEDWREQLKIQALGGVLRERAWGLRYEKGYGLYHIGAFGLTNKDMERYEIGFNFNCTKKDLPLLQKEVRGIISEIKSGSITDKRFKKGLKRMNGIYRKERAYKPREMQERLYEYYRYDSPWLDPVKVQNFVKSLTIDDIVETANKYCKEENLFEFVMGDNGNL